MEKVNSLIIVIDNQMTDEKVLWKKIENREGQIERISHLGPFIVMVAGILIVAGAVVLVFSFASMHPSNLALGMFANQMIPFGLLGFVILGAGVWWDRGREQERQRLRDEIEELKAELPDDIHRSD